MQAEAVQTKHTVSEMKPNETGVVIATEGGGALKSALAAHGIDLGTELRFVKSAPLGDPIQLRVMGGNICIRKKDAAGIWVEVSGEKGGTGL